MHNVPDNLSQTFTALGDPTRRAILHHLQSGPLAVGALSRPFALSAPAITRHIKVLERAGLISRTKDRQRRICTLRQDRLAEATEWLEQMQQEMKETSHDCS